MIISCRRRKKDRKYLKMKIIEFATTITIYCLQSGQKRQLLSSDFVFVFVNDKMHILFTLRCSPSQQQKAYSFYALVEPMRLHQTVKRICMVPMIIILLSMTKLISFYDISDP